MASITSLKASDGSGNASVATVQSVRSPLATTLVVDTVQGINTKFHATMGTPHTFVDPVTSETITVISEASAVDFQGHVDGGNLEIDTIAPGFVDNGSAVSDIVIIKPTTQWADEVAKVLEVTHNDNGTLKTDSVDSTQIKPGSVTADKNDFTTWNAGGYTSIVGQEIKTSNRSTGVSGTEVGWNGCATMSYNAVSGKRYKLTMHEYILDGYGGSGQMKFHFRHCSSGTWSSSGDMFCQSIIYVNSGGTAGVDTTVYFTAPTTGTAYVAIGFSSFGITGSFTIYADSTSPGQYTIERV